MVDEMSFWLEWSSLRPHLRQGDHLALVPYGRFDLDVNSRIDFGRLAA
ncbi:hypothetical protein [Agrobacterium tumefaciens]|jgi:hypothetical protein|nr:hypothetical protein FY143_23690 [Agrobacterium tumefaciens]UXU08408.1 hypothetical protein FY128_23590 [Agrobacterium tumefaciens]